MCLVCVVDIPWPPYDHRQPDTTTTTNIIQPYNMSTQPSILNPYYHLLKYHCILVTTSNYIKPIYHYISSCAELLLWYILSFLYSLFLLFFIICISIIVCIIHTIDNTMPINISLEKGCVKFIWTCINSHITLFY